MDTSGAYPHDAVDAAGDACCATAEPSVAEDRQDRARLKALKTVLEEVLPGRAEVHVDDAQRWSDRWRVPVTFAATSRVAKEHFDAVARAGADLVAEETFSETQMYAYYVEMAPSRIRGFRAWPKKDQGLCLALLVVLVLCVVQLVPHVIAFVGP